LRVQPKSRNCRQTPLTRARSITTNESSQDRTKQYAQGNAPDQDVTKPPHVLLLCMRSSQMAILETRYHINTHKKQKCISALVLQCVSIKVLLLTAQDISSPSLATRLHTPKQNLKSEKKEKYNSAGITNKINKEIPCMLRLAHQKCAVFCRSLSVSLPPPPL
jgi:hypothetical protein